MSENLLQTKLFTPTLRPFLTPRPHLIKKLNAGLGGKLTLVSAPARFGKTTLIADWGMQIAELGITPHSAIYLNPPAAITTAAAVQNIGQSVCK